MVRTAVPLARVLTGTPFNAGSRRGEIGGQDQEGITIPSTKVQTMRRGDWRQMVFFRTGISHLPRDSWI